MLTAQTFGRPTAIKITGVRLEDWPENTIVMANHQTYVDWAYIWALMYHANVPHGMCALAKDSIRNVPVIGWLLDVFGFVFISRTWSQDKSTVEQHMQKLGESREPCWLTVFPEGTIMYPEGHAKSMAYAQLHGFDHPKRLLLPRITGLFHCLEGLKQQKVRYLMDLTIAYEGMGDDDVPYLVYNVPGILMHGDAPPVIHIDVRLHPVDEIPNDEEKFGDWLRERWMEKDQLLATFSETGSLASQDQYSKWIDMRMDRPAWVELCPFAVIVVPLLFAVDIMYAWLGSTLLYAIYGTLILTVLRSYKLLLE
ncbi:acyltransferase-domain-containing protein [Ramicandelaber brevisporus]|nr:acyltransferase-domain-containing protein [Ramicandelaber brevisporus]KAI8873375.1 acyltransferase-domain-containing protein [Ramicandelaber brevisporus]